MLEHIIIVFISSLVGSVAGPILLIKFMDYLDNHKKTKENKIVRRKVW